jgi:hypothetical protein
MPISKKSEGATDRLNRRVNQHPSESRILVTRNLSYGAAAAALIVMIEIIQIGAKDPALELAVQAACLSMPIWIAVGVIYEFFIFLGKASYPFLRKEAFQRSMGFFLLVAGVSLLIEIGSVAYYLSERSLWLFIGSIVGSLALVLAVWEVLARWWYGPQGPGSKEDSHDA